MVILWLLSVPHRSQRFPVAGRRLKARLQRYRWLEDLLAANAIPITWDDSHGAHREVSVFAIGLVKVRQGQCYDGPLSAWSRECRLLHSYFFYPKDAVEVVVEDVFLLLAPLPITHRYDDRSHVFSIRGTAGIIIPCGLSQELVGACIGERCGLQQTSVRQVLQVWEFAPARMGELRAALVVEPIAKLVMKGKWSSLLLLARWHDCCDLISWPQHLLDAEGQHEEPCELSSFDIEVELR